MTRVYGLDSTSRVRNEILMELLKERVALHKDKFISPTLYKELTGLVLKKNGKIDHSELTHDDQILSYLLGLYVWYEGKNLREYWGIEKSSIKTDEDIDDIMDLTTDVSKKGSDISKQLKRLYSTVDNKDSAKLEQDLMNLQKGQGLMFKNFIETTRKKEEEHLREMLRHEHIKEAYARYHGVPVEAVTADVDIDNTFGNLSAMPNSIFTDFYKDENEMDALSIYKELNKNSVSNIVY